VHGADAAVAEGAVDGAVGQVADEREVVDSPAGGRAPADDELPVVLARDRDRDVAASEVGGHLAVRPEARIGTAVGHAARDVEVAARRAVGDARDDELPVRLAHERVHEVVVRRGPQAHDAARAEGGVEGAARQIAGDEGIVGRAHVCLADDDDLAVGLDQDGAGPVGVGTEGGGHDAARPERGIEIPGCRERRGRPSDGDREHGYSDVTLHPNLPRRL
jgi:hypothetical protein